MADSGVLIPKPTDVFVSPLYKLHPADVQAGIDVFDKWLRSISDGWITVDRLKGCPVTVGKDLPTDAG